MIKIKQIEDLASSIQKAEENAKKYADDKFEVKFAKNTAFNKNFGTNSGEVAEGNHTHGVASTTINGLMSSADKAKLDEIAEGATKYVHPDSHPASMIVQDAANRLVTDEEKAAWNGKASTALVTSSANGLMSSVDKIKLDNHISGDGTFNSQTGITIAIGRTMVDTNYKVAVTPTSNPGGTLGEIWVADKTTTTFTVYCSGSTTTTTFDWVIC